MAPVARFYNIEPFYTMLRVLFQEGASCVTVQLECVNSQVTLPV